jgi:phenylalanyl-tRNA synthetase beta subunit
VIKYPAAEFEFTVLMNERDPFNNLLNAMGNPKGLTKSNETVMETAEHLTTYTGDPIPAGNKAVSVKIRWRNSSRTIQHDELKNIQDKLITSLQAAGYSLR